jgi:hypothetical protein
MCDAELNHDAEASIVVVLVRPSIAPTARPGSVAEPIVNSTGTISMGIRTDQQMKSTLLGGPRSPATCANAGPHSGGREIHGKDGVAGSIPAGGFTQALTSGNAGRRHVR